jgi:chromosome partitioning protein
MSMLMSTILKIKDDLEHYAYFLGVVINMFDPKISLHSSIVEAITEYFTARKIFKTKIYRNPKIPEAEIHGQSLAQYSPKNQAVEAFTKVAKEIVQKTNEREK